MPPETADLIESLLLKECQCSDCKRSFVPSPFDEVYVPETEPKVSLCESCMLIRAAKFQMSRGDPVNISRNRAETVCKFGQGEAMCAFLGMPRGFTCVKGSSQFDAAIRASLAKGSSPAKGNCCAGPPDFAPIAAKTG